MVRTSVDMQKEVGTTNFSVPFRILWLTVIYGARITDDIGYYFLGELSNCSGTSTNKDGNFTHGYGYPWVPYLHGSGMGTLLYPRVVPIPYPSSHG
jgi:hypothetical protein